MTDAPNVKQSVFPFNAWRACITYVIIVFYITWYSAAGLIIKTTLWGGLAAGLYACPSNRIRCCTF